MIADICSDIIRGGEIPESWHKHTINVLHKAGPTLVPVSAPVIYMKQSEIDPATLGEVRPEHACYAGYRKLLRDAMSESYVKLVSP